QFVFSLVLIAGTLIVRQQVLFMKNAETGSDKEHVVVLPLELDDFAASPEAARQLALFKQTVAAHNVVASVSSSSNVPGSWPDRFTFARPEGWQDRNPARVRFAFVDHKFFDTYGIRFLEGRNFIEGSESDRRNALVVNEAALRDFGWESGAGKRITVGRNELQVMGVVSDYNFQSLQNAVMPVLHVFREPENGVHNFVSVRIRPGRISEALAMLERAWRNMDPSRAFEYFFVDDAFEQLYRTQDRLVTVAWAFSALAIVIACLGLLGLTPLMISQRTKEIGIRKVLGASVANVTALLSRDFVKLVLLANLIAVPVAWIAMNKWLQNFAYRIGIEWWVFALAGSLALVIALVTVSTQAVRAALANPVVSLRYE
ncbi:MAG: ABC transporter permease, partial [bacterium]